MIFVHGEDDIDTVLEIRRTAIETLKSGGLEVTSWNSEGTSVTKTRGLSLTKIIEECNAFLREEDPDLYGRRVKKAIPVYTHF